MARTSSTPRSCAARPSRPPRRSAGSSSPRGRSSCPTASPSWQPFREANAAMDRLRKRYEVGIVSNIDDKLLGVSRRHLRTELDLVVTAQQVRSYKPDPAHFKECARRIGGKKGWVHIASGYETDVAPAPEDERARDLGQPQRREARRAARRPPRRSRTFRDAAKRLGAGADGRPARSRRRGDGRAGARAIRGGAPAGQHRRALGRARGRASQPDRHRRAQVRDDEPAPLPQPPSGDRDVAAQGAQLLRRRAQLAARAATGTRATSTRRRRIRGESSPHYTNRPRFDGVAERMRELLGSDVRLVYVVRDPIDRMLSHYLHNVGGGLRGPIAGRCARRPGVQPTSPAAATSSSSSPTSRQFGAESGSRSSAARS